MPVGDFFLSKFPAQQNYFAFDFAGEVEESDVEVFDLHTGGVNFGDGVFDSLQCFFALGLAAGKFRDVQERSAIEEDAVSERFEFGVDFFDQFLAIDGGAQERLEHWQQHAGFFESKSASGHCCDFTRKVGWWAGIALRAARSGLVLGRPTPDPSPRWRVRAVFGMTHSKSEKYAGCRRRFLRCIGAAHCEPFKTRSNTT